MFARIAGRYDLANRILSAGVDRRWRRRLVSAVRSAGGRMILDVATGSGDVAFALARALPSDTLIQGVDFCAPMLDEARRKQQANGVAPSRLTFATADALALPFADATFDALTIAFGLRNLADRPKGLAEFRRVLKPGGKLVVLEFSQTGEPEAYHYLARTIGAFPDRKTLSGEILAAGFSSVQAAPLTFGISALHEAVR
jgi:demethylmenaquinone methyltransferase/2-methoxy-6-polyprenyl-1,4-benzoquinol methylase